MKVRILCRDCDHVETDARFFAGGLAVTPWHCPDCKFSEDLFVVSHIGTGRKLGSAGIPFHQAKRRLMRLLELTDWTRPEIFRECEKQNLAWVKNAKAILGNADEDRSDR